MTCKHCDIKLAADEIAHGKELKCHRGLCCDCLDLSFGMSLAALNEERARKGRTPINKTWPGLDEDGNNLAT